jgi:formate dehydrogenase major subunit
MAVWDIEHSDAVLIMGSNMAENHPIAFRFVVAAQRRGAVVMHVDPRFTRTSALADIHAPIRSGSDIAFLGGIIRYILENDLWFRDFVTAYTNIDHIIEDGYGDPEQNDGLFSGFDADTGTYALDSWQYKGKMVPSSISEHRVQTQEPSAGGDDASMTESPPPTDPTLQHPHCVYQIMRRHYARYTPEMVEQVTGCPRETFLAIAATLARNSGRERTGAICYAVGWTHHTTGVQIIRAAAIIQGLLGNIGRAAAFWRCAGMPASRAAPTSRRCTTCCRPTCRSRTHSNATPRSPTTCAPRRPARDGGTTCRNTS